MCNLSIYLLIYSLIQLLILDDTLLLGILFIYSTLFPIYLLCVLCQCASCRNQLPLVGLIKLFDSESFFNVRVITDSVIEVGIFPVLITILNVF